ncbi:cysteine-rich DPF motif domain-containing protein 1 isoform X1 [Protopterus annectens]|uniref:cysteine-rich DPF motif domain-containing protein 1 isoform X1 n=1 Tax=Protopterus annectens TaxID=7888 RepID=UPI001CF95DD1|nr:cysteine-rich DPF motif domain-containing protein 1 isoform X1 [Protopterus annectens]XP_043944197.1 cysteine-rich DPF motif domain-containing protein 1 isoform X1 [Protopterus annectens]
MQPGEESSSKVKFECQLCGFTAPYSYYGQKPPNSRSIVFLEECFIMKDPFTPEKGKFLILGSHCSLCNKITCVNGDCSIFYTRRFCLPCAKSAIQDFPKELQHELEKRKLSQKTKSSS